LIILAGIFMKTTIGLTGGIATGKTVAAEVFKALGASVVDADVAARDVVLPGSAGFKAVAAAFPEAVCGDAIDRRALRNLVFDDADKLKKLNAITHPLIFARCKELIAAAESDTVILVAPLLYEAGFESMVSAVICTVCSQKTQIARLTARDGISELAAQKIIDAQMPQKEKAARADYVLDTDLPIEEWQAAAKAVYQKMTQG
jgi:dephospho-CoA kinase